MSNYLKNQACDTAISHRTGLTSLRYLPLIFLTLVIGACASTPKPEPQALPEPTQEQQSSTVEPIIDYDRRNYEAALKALKTDETDFAIELLEQVGNKAPDMEYVFTNLGLAYFKNKNYSKAEQSLQKAISLNSRDVIALNHLGIIKRMQGHFEGAKQTYRQAIAIDDDYAQAYLNLGILYDMYLQDLEQALDQYQKYQTLTNSENKTVSEWIVDIERRIKTVQAKTQG